MEATIELIKITGVSQFCVFAGQVRYGFNKPVDSTAFQKGHTYSVAVVTGTKGGKYISRVNSDLGALEVEPSTGSVLNPELNQQPVGSKVDVPAPTFNKTWTKKPFAGKSGLSEEQWAAKNTQMSRAGAIQAAVQAVSSHCSNVDEIKVKALPLAEFIIEFATQKDAASK